jgi:DNA-directed RNA polymerase alpha subunit
VKHDAHFKELVKELEKMGVEVHKPIAEMNEKTTDRSVVELFESKVVKALVNEAGCYKLSDIAKLSSYDLLSVKGIGYRAYQTIIEKMRENDFELL